MVSKLLGTVLVLVRYGLALLAVLGMVRAFLGPTAADRVVAINYVVTLVILLILLSSSREDLSLYLDVVLVFVLGAFIATLRILKLLEEGKL